MERKIKFIYFDLGNVILNFDHDLACQNIAGLCGIEAEKVRQLVFESELQHRYESGQVTTVEFYEEFCKQTGTQPNLGELCYAASSIFKLNVPVVSVISQLKFAGHRLGILSNTCEAHWEYATKKPFGILNDFFDVVALSYEIGSMKPEPEIYQRAIEMAGVGAGEIFFMDDRPENVAAACDAGMDSVVFESPEQLFNELRIRNIAINS